MEIDRADTKGSEKRLQSMRRFDKYRKLENVVYVMMEGGLNL